MKKVPLLLLEPFGDGGKPLSLALQRSKFLSDVFVEVLEGKMDLGELAVSTNSRLFDVGP